MMFCDRIYKSVFIKHLHVHVPLITNCLAGNEMSLSHLVLNFAAVHV